VKPVCEASAVSERGPESCPSAGRRKSGMLRGLEAYSEDLGLVGGQVTTDPACLIVPILPRFVPRNENLRNRSVRRSCRFGGAAGEKPGVSKHLDRYDGFQIMSLSSLPVLLMRHCLPPFFDSSH
jgi:hypothetical protein